MPGAFRTLFARGGPPPDAPRPREAPSARVDDAPPPAVPPAPGPPPRRLSPERERRELTHRREIELRDVGGLAAEMARRDDWRYPLLHSRCADVLAIEERIHELDAIIAASEMTARGVAVAPCQCGAPILRGAHFCSNCGRPAPEVSPVVACSHCGQPLPADASFCPACGNPVAANAFEGDAIEDTFVDPVPPREGARGGP